MKKVGSNIQNIAKTNKISGIQRVVIETHKVLKLSLASSHISLNGILTRGDELSINFYSSEYYKSDPVLNGNITTVNEVDLLLFLDALLDAFLDVLEDFPIIFFHL